MKILIVSDAWEPQVNGVVRTLKMTRRELEALGHQTELISPLGFHSMPCPTYPEISLALTTRGELERRIDAFAPDCLHIATEGPLGWLGRSIALRRKWPFTTAYHSRFPEYVHARFRMPVRWTCALLRRFHNAARATLAPTPAIVDDLKARGFANARLWSRRVDLASSTPAGRASSAPDRSSSMSDGLPWKSKSTPFCALTCRATNGWPAKALNGSACSTLSRGKMAGRALW